MTDKVCFIVSTIGEEGSPERAISDEKFDLILQPVLMNLGYEAIRADKENTPNSISRDIISRVIHSELVIADVSDSNPNVFYELAIRNAVKKPVIVIRKSGQKLPFDIYDKRAITIDMTKNREWIAAKDLITAQVRNAEKEPEKASESIVSDFTFSLSVKKTASPTDELSLEVKDLKDSISRLNRMVAAGFKFNNPAVESEPPIHITTSKSQYSVGDVLVVDFSIMRGGYSQLIFEVLSPEEVIMNTINLPHTPGVSGSYSVNVYRFRKNDPPGRWRIRARSPDSTWAVSRTFELESEGEHGPI